MLNQANKYGENVKKQMSTDVAMQKTEIESSVDQQQIQNDKSKMEQRYLALIENVLKEKLAVLDTIRDEYNAKIDYAKLQIESLENENDDYYERIKALENQINDYANLVSYERQTHANQIQEYDALVSYERTVNSQQISELERRSARFEAMYLEIRNSGWWRITKPGRAITGAIRWLVKKILKLVKVHKIRTAWAIYRREGKAGIKRVLYEKKHGILVAPNVTTTGAMVEMTACEGVQTDNQAKTISIAQWYRDTGNPVHAIPTIITTEKVKRLNLVTDTIESSSLLGGVATALIVATQFCVKYGYELRIITRNAEPVPMNYENILRINKLEHPVKVSYYSDYNDSSKKVNYKMDITEDDIFIATSWWSAEAIRRTTLRKRFFYIIQEAETFFYHYGGERVMCESLMHDPNIDYIINSHFLNDYFKEHEPNVHEHGVYFEPAFSEELYHADVNIEKNHKHRLFFYGRPHNPRNLFNYGINILDEAIRKRVINTDEWEICLAGADVAPITFCDGSKSVSMGQMSWEEYAKFLRGVDLALCLMYTPHPSYPPFDVACSGGVVVSNKYMSKQSFPQSNNVLMADLTTESLLEKLREGVKLALDDKLRKDNYETATIPRHWDETLNETLAFMEECAK